jgi:ATP-dependent DNA helicase RecQ
VINEQEIATRFKITAEEVKQLLAKLVQLEIVKYIPKNNNAQITYLKHRKDVEFLNLNEQKWESRKEYEQEKLSKITNYITEKKECRSKLLLHYFGEEDSDQCGKCDFCIRQKRERIKEVEYQKISDQLEKILNDNELTLEEICALLPKINEEELINVIQFLFDNDKIGKFGNKYQWRSI